ncbi:MAG TPA: DUF4350 domain-containing protein [Pyrinomonadaceae bacterium]|nr:DUF4350 domain-containing protein [Pyrinomonadaceae bacterium]
MRQRLTIILTFVVIIGLLIILNTLTYVNEDKSADVEANPNRSTYHSGPTGTRALHDFLNESGYKVIRWRDTPEKLLGNAGKVVATFVVIGPTQISFTEEEAAVLHRWVSRGGRLVLIDRWPDSQMLPKSNGWSVKSIDFGFPSLDVNPADATQMTENVKPLKPVQPTPFTRNVESVMPSRFASRLRIVPPSAETTKAAKSGNIRVVPLDDEEKAEVEEFFGPPAPIVHVADYSGALLVDYSYGQGNIIVLSDPYIVANGGIKLNDNLQLAINTLAGQGGLIAFDEYHQGKGVNQNEFARYFAGTPVLAIAAQIVLLVLLILWTRARRFARPLPLAKVDRRSSLEFVASMAELQERSRAFDLAIENIYTRTRRVLARHAGIDYNSSRSEIATRIASRSTIDRQRLETLMRQCEEAINGEPINWRQAIDLVRRLREVERELGLRMRSRDLRQAAENI